LQATERSFLSLIAGVCDGVQNNVALPTALRGSRCHTRSAAYEEECLPNPLPLSAVTGWWQLLIRAWHGVERPSLGAHIEATGHRDQSFGHAESRELPGVRHWLPVKSVHLQSRHVCRVLTATALPIPLCQSPATAWCNMARVAAMTQMDCTAVWQLAMLSSWCYTSPKEELLCIPAHQCPTGACATTVLQHTVKLNSKQAKQNCILSYNLCCITAAAMPCFYQGAAAA